MAADVPRAALAILLVSLACLLSSGASAEITPLSPQPDEGALQPGLAVTYYYDFYRHIDHIVKKMNSESGVDGEPLPALNYRVGTGIVLSADRNDGVGAHIRGVINLDQPGTYWFALESNDGVRFALGGEILLEDPDVHADQWSNVATVEVTEPGWYPVELLYFERKNTSTLRLVWKNPEIGESGKFKPVPEKCFAHLESE